VSRAIGKGNAILGTMACLVCSREIPVKETPGGKLSCACQWCDLPLYVNPHTEAFDRVMRLVKRAPAPAADPGTSAASSSSSSSTAASSPASSSKPAEEGAKKPPARGWLTGVGGNPFGQ